MAVLHDFICKRCNVIFEDVTDFNRNIGRCDPKECPQCSGLCETVWIKAPSFAGDENLTREEKVACALKMGFDRAGRLTIPQTRSDLKKFKAVYGDIGVGEKEILTRDKKQADVRSTVEREADKAKTVDFIQERRAKRRAGEIPIVREVDKETAEAIKSAPLSPTRILTKKGA